MPARSTGCSSSTGSWPRSCTSVTGPRTTCSPAGSAQTAPPSPVPSAQCGPCSPSEAAPSVPACGCGRRTRSSTTSAPGGGPGSSTPSRSRLRAQEPGQVHLRQEQAERRQDHGCSRTGTAGCCSAARPSPEAARTSPTPAGEGRSSSWPTGPPWKLLADAGYQGPGGADQRSGADTAAPQVQEGHPRLVQGDTRAAAEGTILTTHPPRAQAIALTRRVTSPHIRRISPGDPHREGPTPGPGRGRAHPAGRRGRWTRPRQPAHHAATSAPGSRPGKTFGDRDEQVSSVPRATRRAQTRRSRRPRTSRPCPTYTLGPRSRRLRPSSPSAGRSGRVP